MKSCKHIWMLNLILMLSVPCLEIVIGFDERQKARLDLPISCLDCSGEDAERLCAETSSQTSR